jgi:alginate O-acetyltransferase complex protein AlgI
MLFNSWGFLLFASVLFVLYYLPLMRRIQVGLLTLASLFFYGYGEPKLVLLLIASILVNGLASYRIVNGEAARRRFWMAIGVAVNLGILVFFKYSGLLWRTFGGGGESELGRWITNIPLPIGISFFTFQGISLLVDIYRKPSLYPPRPVARHLLEISFFKAFFPQLVAGPIVKGRDFLPQIRTGARLHEIDWVPATKDLVMGFFLKMVVADHLKEQTFWLANPYFKAYSSFTLLAMVFGYSMQIFADFSGYSLIARGLAALFGYRLPQNFDFPYISQSFSEFWRRWHISLSTWLRDYLYIPLGGNQRGPFRTYMNLMIVMGLGGLWHGATWSYAIWGLWHGIALAVERFLTGGRSASQAEDKPFAWLNALFVFVYVSLGWILFKMPQFSDAWELFHAIATQTALEHNKKVILNLAVYSVPVMLYHFHYLYRSRTAAGHAEAPAGGSSGLLTCAVYGALLFLILVNSGGPGAFIYFQF